MKEIIARIKSQKYILDEAQRKSKKWSIEVNVIKKRISDLSFQLEEHNGKKEIKSRIKS